MQVLAARLSDKGWTVLAPDARGYGDSDDPREPDDPRSWNTLRDVSGLLQALSEIPGVDPTRIVVMGHYQLRSGPGVSVGGLSASVLPVLSAGTMSDQQSLLLTEPGQMLDPGPEPPVHNGEFPDHAIAISGNTIAVGAAYHSAYGAAYVFEKTVGDWPSLTGIAPNQPFIRGGSL